MSGRPSASGQHWKHIQHCSTVGQKAVAECTIMQNHLHIVCIECHRNAICLTAAEFFRDWALPTWNATGTENATLNLDLPPPYKGHRWLPLRQNNTNISKTPISKSAYEKFSPNWKSWAIGAQTHYSFFRILRWIDWTNSRP